MSVPSTMSPGMRLNLERTVVLLVDDNPKALDVTSSMLRGLGVRKQFKCASSVEAKDVLATQEIDLVLIDAAMPGLDGYDFTKWVRREAPPDVQFTPVVLVSSHPARGMVEKARDCGANFVVSKPFTPQILMERIYWISKDERQIVKCAAYVGPDRRFRNLGPPVGQKGRRAGDLSERVGEAKEPNLGQNEIDMLFKPARVSL